VNELALGYPEGRIELQLIGGFRDQQGYAEDLFSNIMREFEGEKSRVSGLASGWEVCRYRLLCRRLMMSSIKFTRFSLASLPSAAISILVRVLIETSNIVGLVLNGSISCDH
jgi:hypothetical protein